MASATTEALGARTVRKVTLRSIPAVGIDGTLSKARVVASTGSPVCIVFR